MAANLARVLASADNEPVTEAYAYAAQASLPKALYSLVIAELGYCERNVGRKLSDSASVLSSKLALFDGRSALANGYCMVLLLLVTTQTIPRRCIRRTDTSRRQEREIAHANAARDVMHESPLGQLTLVRSQACIRPNAA
ncbi:hypothetical protein MRX96_056859 [Rhipicephalus microplus]